MHIHQAVKELAMRAEISENWLPLLCDLTVRAVESVKTSSRLLNDEMSLHKFVKIKRLAWFDRSRSMYIHGLMATKNVADRRMASKI